MRKVFKEWEQLREQDNINPLFIFLLYDKFYKAFCKQVALELLATSQKNMKDFEAAIVADKAGWSKKFAALLDWLKEDASWLSRNEDEELRLLQQAYSAELTKFSQETVQHLYEVQKELATPRVKEIRAELSLVQQLEPLLVLLTLQKDANQITPEAAIARFAALMDQNQDRADAAVEQVLTQLQWLIDRNKKAEDEVRDKPDEVYKVQLVQEVADAQLKPWYDHDPFFAKTIENLKAGAGLLAFIGLTGVLLALAFIFPPAAAAAATLVVGAGFAVSSISDAVHLYRMRHARLAQLGFQPLVSEGEVTAAIIQATVDVAFVLLEAKGLGRAIGEQAECAVARKAAGALAASLEESSKAWRALDAWPKDLTDALRSQLREQIEATRPGWLASLGAGEAAAVDELTRDAQKALLARYEREVGEFLAQFEREVRSGKISAKDLKPWLQRELPKLDPKTYFQKLGEDELRSGKDLFDRLLERRLAGLPPAPITAPVEFLEGLSPSELEELVQGLGKHADLLGVNRLRYLRDRAGLTGLTYTELARRLKSVLDRVAEPAAVLGKLETLLERQRNALEFLEALGDLPNPGFVVEMATPDLLNATLLGGTRELVAALTSPAQSGWKVARFFAQIDETGARRVFRMVEQPTGCRAVQRWVGPGRRWVASAVRAVEEAAPLRAIESITAEERAKALEELEKLAKIRTPSGALSAPARRIKEALAAIDSSTVKDALRERLANIAVREGQEVVGTILDRLGNFLKTGKTNEALLSGTVAFLKRSDGKTLAGLLAARRTGPAGCFEPTWSSCSARSGSSATATCVVSRSCSSREESPASRPRPPSRSSTGSTTRAVFGALNDIAPHSTGLDKVIGYLKSISQNRNQAALGQLLAAKLLLEEHPGTRLIFEQAIEREGRLIREIDVRLVTADTLETILDVELKEVTFLFVFDRPHTLQQFLRDVVRSARSARPGERRLGRIRWMIREPELIGKRVEELLAKGVAEEQAKVQARMELKATLRDKLHKGFDLLDQGEMVSEFRSAAHGLTPEQWKAARDEFLQNYERLIQLF